jgi:hypothetical protein
VALTAVISRVSDLIEWGKRLEAEGRRIAVERGKEISEVDVQWARGVNEWHSSLGDLAEKLVFAISESEYRDISAVCDLGRSTSFEMWSAIRDAVNIYPRNTPLFKLTDVKSIVRDLREYAESVGRLTGRSPHLVVDYVHIADYSWSDLVMDFTNCLSQLLDWITVRLGSVVEVVRDKAYASTRSMPVAVDCAKKWALSLDSYKFMYLINYHDYHYAVGFARENEAAFRLGVEEKGEKNRARAVFTPLSARVEYHYSGDYRESVHVVFARLSEHYGCRVVEQKPGEYTVVEIPRGALADFFSGVLALAVSMDARLKSPHVYWGLTTVKDLKNEYERLKDQVDPLELEFRLCIEAKKRIETYP